MVFKNLGIHTTVIVIFSRNDYEIYAAVYNLDFGEWNFENFFA